MEVLGSILFFIFALIISAIVGFFLYPSLLQFYFPNMDLGIIWVTITKFIIFMTGVGATFRCLAWFNQGRDQQD